MNRTCIEKVSTISDPEAGGLRHSAKRRIGRRDLLQSDVLDCRRSNDWRGLHRRRFDLSRSRDFAGLAPRLINGTYCSRFFGRLLLAAL